jgi:carbonic anhydrase
MGAIPIEHCGPGISADEALRRLVDGNRRFLRGEARFATMQKELLADLAKGQQPFATILGCSDSRVPPELIFDAGLGELFVIRVAGNVLSPEIAGSLQYAGAHLHTPLFVVLGHEGCGAVHAALASKHQGVQQRSRIQILVDSILLGLPDIDPQLPIEVQVAQAVESNVRWTVRQIRESPEGRVRLAEGQMKLKGAIYEIQSGRVRFLDDEPPILDRHETP